MPALQCRRGLRCQGDGEVKRRTVTDRALDPDLATMHLDDLLNDREAQAGPGYRLGRAASHPAESLEHVADLVARDAKTRACDADQHQAAVRAQEPRHPPP